MDGFVAIGASSGRAERLRMRQGLFTGPTSGLAPGNVQANLVILPQDLANDFLRFAQANPRPCPVLGVTEVGDPRLPMLGEDLDLRTDLPRYRVWRHGELVEEPTDIGHFWRDDLVGFAIGCSFSFEEALIEDGIEVRHIACGCNVPMYRTNVDCVPAGVFHGKLVVSMRPMKPADAIRAVQITSRFPSVHGAPVHIGLPGLIGIKRHRQTRLRRRGAGGRRRAAGVLGLRRDAAIGDCLGEAGILHHPRAGQHADHRPA